MVITDSELFEKVKLALNEFANSQMTSFDGSSSEYDLIALVPNERETKYTLLVSAYWLDDGYEEFDIIDALLPFLHEQIPNKIYKINNIGIINSTEILVKALIENYPNIDGKLELFDITIGSNHFDKILILKTK